MSRRSGRRFRQVLWLISLDYLPKNPCHFEPHSFAPPSLRSHPPTTMYPSPHALVPTALYKIESHKQMRTWTLHNLQWTPPKMAATLRVLKAGVPPVIMLASVLSLFLQPPFHFSPHPRHRLSPSLYLFHSLVASLFLDISLIILICERFLTCSPLCASVLRHSQPYALPRPV